MLRSHWYTEQKNKRVISKDDGMKGSYLRCEFDQKQIEKEFFGCQISNI